jgi:hypothetical protein
VSDSFTILLEVGLSLRTTKCLLVQNLMVGMKCAIFHTGASADFCLPMSLSFGGKALLDGNKESNGGMTNVKGSFWWDLP